MLGNVDFLEVLQSFKDHVDEFLVPKQNWKEVRAFLNLPHFRYETIAKKNRAAGNVVNWVKHIVEYHDAILGLEPKRAELAEVSKRLEDATAILNAVNARVDELQARLDKLIAVRDEARSFKDKALEAVQRGELKIDLARRILKSLGDGENWAKRLDTYEKADATLVGDLLIATTYIAYAGPLTKKVRESLVQDKWIPFLEKAAAGEPIVISESMSSDPLSGLSTEHERAQWQVEGLASDPVSVENGIILMRTNRIPLLVDPHLQGIAWLKGMGAEILKADQSDLFQRVKSAISGGGFIVIENIKGNIDPALMSIAKGKNPECRLYFHTTSTQPVFPPEIHAECSIIDFSLTQSGLQCQLFNIVLQKERQVLADQRVISLFQINLFDISLNKLEDEIIHALVGSGNNACEDKDLIETLEASKQSMDRICEKRSAAYENVEAIESAIGSFQAVAARGSLVYFIVNSMHNINSYYVYNLNAFVSIFLRGIDLVSDKNGKKKD